ncbi:MAG TPA: Hsp33 family molecular chaperone HslO [Rhodocyclaceae bacterium]|nr:Hsp33 family molecular chaperone HslO [Rhodocyclaceae bacterium]
MDAVSGFLFEELDIRAARVALGPAWRQMASGRGYPAPVGNLLGQMAAVTTLIGSNLKTPGRLTFHLQGSGPVRLLVVDCDEQLRLRGTAKAAAEVAAAPLPALLGDGQLALTLQTEGSGRPYQSIVPLAGDSVAAVFEHYLALSEQTPARLFLHADDTNAAGLLLQKLPEADRRDADGWNRIGLLADTLRPAELLLPMEDLVTRLFGEETVRLFPPRPVTYHCPRDEAKVLAMLSTLGRDEVEKMLAEAGEVHIHDDICNQDYRFGPEVLERLFAAPSRSIH